MKRSGWIIPAVLIALLLCSCTGQATPAVNDKETPAVGGQETPTARGQPTPAVLADTFFFGHAYVDTNGNGHIDEQDAPLAGAPFAVTLQGGGGFGGTTAKDGTAFVVVPGGLDESYWPVTAQMKAPEGSAYQVVGPDEILLEYPKTRAEFLFAAP